MVWRVRTEVWKTHGWVLPVAADATPGKLSSRSSRGGSPEKADPGGAGMELAEGEAAPSVRGHGGERGCGGATRGGAYEGSGRRWGCARSGGRVQGRTSVEFCVKRVRGAWTEHDGTGLGAVQIWVVGVGHGCGEVRVRISFEFSLCICIVSEG
ncbi:uncharacterized protein M6B38_324155 [Iris pallida]|uniref:Uncharacterized protein n=1 Tax=Iris pallida TaxID=29817 RepID=A0AAX6H8L1_IRIPA|nr:uncharacterized protein M6B38_324155 [Iris pallida]